MDNKLNLAQLETKLDFLETEFSHLHELLIKIGFPNGIDTLKETAQSMLDENLAVE
ncbi:MAG: hypothetical protein COT84_08140 [Chlamydiae bacterium CG10_big_fil_rev_8_21_14_0_10_35_9]|nr:MAG: hypothetical protein COT84_08140 [Chlamydiae bacterium CG10_big_fil_rev_8_21_14_0_10_35_9]